LTHCGFDGPIGVAEVRTLAAEKQRYRPKNEMVETLTRFSFDASSVWD
jgi:hypothetical protein